MYAAYRAAGLQGLFFWLILLGSCLVLVIYIHCAASSGNAKTALLGGLAAWFFATITLSIRPLMLGHLFLALELLLLHLGKTRDRKPPAVAATGCGSVVRGSVHQPGRN